MSDKSQSRQASFRSQLLKLETRGGSRVLTMRNVLRRHRLTHRRAFLRASVSLDRSAQSEHRSPAWGDPSGDRGVKGRGLPSPDDSVRCAWARSLSGCKIRPAIARSSRKQSNRRQSYRIPVEASGRGSRSRPRRAEMASQVSHSGGPEADVPSRAVKPWPPGSAHVC